MQRTTSLIRATALVCALAAPLGAISAPKHHGFLHRHHKAAAAASGYAAYRAAKTTGANRAAHGGHRNFAQRHPFITGAATAAVVNHHLKK